MAADDRPVPLDEYPVRDVPCSTSAPVDRLRLTYGHEELSYDITWTAAWRAGGEPRISISASSRDPEGINRPPPHRPARQHPAARRQAGRCHGSRDERNVR
ncbi:hypothetical protein ABZ078_24995 [Streptomyces sp. NPDC006385]|uniref:hypothetical protein n=1 Tax=Streptomyces sp. NPDC006385 TaxID=3156761 RepID=UPI0033A78362